MLEESSQEALINFPGAREPAVAIELLPTARHIAHDPVNHHVPRTRIERADRLERACGRQIRQVADPADVDDGPRTRGMAKEQEMQVWPQRRPFPTGLHLPAPEVGHTDDAGPLGHDYRTAQLHGGLDR